MQVRELSSDVEIAAAYPLARELRDRIQPETFLAEIRRQQAEGYRLYGGFDEDRLVVLAGVRRSHTLARGEHLFIDDLVTAEPTRGHGHGSEMLRWLACKAVADGLSLICLDSRATARGFYERLGFEFRTSIPSWISAERLAR